MIIKYKNSEKGQAIVYLAIGIVVFLGFVALAIDGGMALADRRHSQNTADAASLAGGAAAAISLENSHINYKNWDCSNGKPGQTAYLAAENAAIARASANNFSIDTNPSDHNGVVAICGSSPHSWYGDKGDIYIDVTVEISATTPSNFLQLVFPKALHNEVDSVTRVRPRQPLGFGNAIVALNYKDCQGHQDGGIMYGNGEIVVQGGGVFSNGCLRGNGQPNVTIHDGGAFGNDLDLGNANWDPAPEKITEQMPDSMYFIKPPPDCSKPNAYNVSSLPATLAKGLYCITGNLTINGGDRITGTDVTIYVPNGKVIVNGTPYLEISAPPANATDASPAIPGLLLYLPPDNPNPVTFNGTEDSVLQGLILAPSSTIQLNGTGGNTYVGQVIGWNVEIGGTSDFSLIYDDSVVYNKPTWIELAK